jgi:hypothetical protein
MLAQTGEYVHLGVSVLAILAILYSLWLVLSLKRSVPGGVVGRQWNILVVLVAMFAAGYLAIPWFGRLPLDTLRLIVALIFLFGAVYVIITIRLIHKVIRALAE